MAEGDAHFFDHLMKTVGNSLDKRRDLHSYQKRQVLFYEGNPIAGVYFIQSGRAKIYKIGPEGKQHILHIAQSGDVLGLESIFAGERFTSTAEMIEEGSVWFIYKQTFFDLLQQNPPDAFQVIKILAKEVLSNEEERVDLAQSSVHERMARLLILHAERYGIQVNKGTRINLRLSREEMAEMIGTAVETAVRLLKELKEEKVIGVEGKDIIIFDRKRLAHQAHLS